MLDLIIRRGQIMDRNFGMGRIGDLAVHQGRVVAVEEELSHCSGAHEIDAQGLLVTPGLVDIHTHLWAGGGFWGADVTAAAWRTGVTSWVDAGSAGAYNLEAMRHYASSLPVSAHALINVSAVGIPGQTGEHHDLANLDVAIGHAVAADHGDFVRGVKARIDRKTVGAHGSEPLRRARELADLLERPLMVHIGYGPPTVADVEPFLTQGDILTHCASGAPSDLAADTDLSPALGRIIDRGVHLDIGHGSGAFDFNVLDIERAAGLSPLISTDLHAISAHGPAFDMPSVMEKMMAAGWSLNEVFIAATASPAAALGLDSGSLRIGAAADIALFAIREQEHPVVDVHGQSRTAPVHIRNVGTMVAGRTLTPQVPKDVAPWVKLSPRQHEVIAERHAELAELYAPRLHRASDFLELFPRDMSTAEPKENSND